MWLERTTPAPFVCSLVPEMHGQISQHSRGQIVASWTDFSGRGSVVGLGKKPQRRFLRHVSRETVGREEAKR